MVNLLKKADLHRSKSKSESSRVRENLIAEINEVRQEMNNTDLWFQMENDSDLIEACIHQREVLNARYRYLMNKIKLDKIS